MSPFRIYIGANDAVGGGDNWSYKTCKAPVRMSPLTNEHPVLGRMPFLLPNQQFQSTDRNSTGMVVNN